MTLHILVFDIDKPNHNLDIYIFFLINKSNGKIIVLYLT